MLIESSFYMPILGHVKSQLIEKGNIPKTEFYRYLQVGDFVDSKITQSMSQDVQILRKSFYWPNLSILSSTIVFKVIMQTTQHTCKNGWIWNLVSRKVMRTAKIDQGVSNIRPRWFNPAHCLLSTDLNNNPLLLLLGLVDSIVNGLTNTWYYSVLCVYCWLHHKEDVFVKTWAPFILYLDLMLLKPLREHL